MKKFVIASAALISIMFASCGRTSDANREQISNAHQEAHEMLQSVQPDSVK